MVDGFREGFPAGIMLEEATEQWARMRMPCACHSPEHDLMIDLEYMSDVKTIMLHFYFPVCTRLYKSWWQEWIHRGKLMWRLFTHGYIKTDGDYIFPDDKSVLDLLSVLLEAYTQLDHRHRSQPEGATHEDTSLSEGVSGSGL